jgi:hydroxymethylbilane synthase
VSRSSLRLATRGSSLARWQAEHVASLLRSCDPEVAVELVTIETTGDRHTDVPLHEIGGQGVFVKEVQQAVLDGRADAAVHSAKDLPSGPPPAGLVLSAVPARADARDALVGMSLRDLPQGARIATGAVRRQAQLAELRPDLVFETVRGNVDTRLGKVPAGGALVVAVAALERLGRADRITEALPVDVMVPQVGQGALAVECRADDERTKKRLESIESSIDRSFVDAERAFLAELGGGCDLPVGANFGFDVDGQPVLRTFLSGPGGVWRDRRHGSVRDLEWVADTARAAAAAVGFRPGTRP